MWKLFKSSWGVVFLQSRLHKVIYNVQVTFQGYTNCTEIKGKLQTYKRKKQGVKLNGNLNHPINLT